MGMSLQAERAFFGDAAADPEAADQAASENQFVTFSVAGEMFAVPMAPVQEIIRVPAVAQLPLAPQALVGLANLRGRVLPIIELRRLFACGERDHDDATRALVIHIGQPLGFVVDRVASVISVEPSEIEPAEGIHSVAATGGYLTGVIKRPRADGSTEMLLVVDFARLIEGQFAAVDATRAGTAGSAGLHEGAALEAAAADAGSSDELRLVSFSVAAQEYALDIGEVQEIVQLPEKLAALPNAPAHVLGLMTLRQRLLPLMSLRTLFGLPALAYSEQQRIVVTALPGGRHVGLVTDSVKEVLSVPRAQAEAMPGILAADADLQEFSAICRLENGKRLVSLIATDRLLRVPGVEAAVDAARAAGDAIATDTATEDPAMRQAGTDDETTDDDDQVVIFRLGTEEFGVPIMTVQEIVRVPETLTRVPKTPAFVEGVINLRGTVLPVIDQRSRLGLPAVPRSEGQRIMVYTLDGQRTGFIVDSVAEVLRIPRADITPAPTLSETQGRLIHRVANLQAHKRLVMLIDPAHLLQGNELLAVRGLGEDGDDAAPAPEAAADAAPAEVLAA
jgi:purine-binding chemotaxis protein CheW